MNFFGTVAVLFLVIPFSFSRVWGLVPEFIDVSNQELQGGAANQSLEFPVTDLVSMNLIDRKVIRFNSSIRSNSTNATGSGVHQLECLDISLICRGKDKACVKKLQHAAIMIYVFFVAFSFALFIVELYDWIKEHMMAQMKVTKGEAV